MLDALVAGTSDPQVLADLAKGKLRAKIPALREALQGRFEAHRALIIGAILSHLDFLDEHIAQLSEAIEAELGPTGANASPRLSSTSEPSGRDRRCLRCSWLAITRALRTSARYPLRARSRSTTSSHLSGLRVESRGGKKVDDGSYKVLRAGSADGPSAAPISAPRVDTGSLKPRATPPLRRESRSPCTRPRPVRRSSFAGVARTGSRTVICLAQTDGGADRVAARVRP